MSTLTAERYQLSVVLRDLKEKKTTEYEKHLATIRELTKENISEFVESILSDKTIELSDQFKILHRFSNLISKTFENTGEQLLLQLGEYQGVILLAQELVFSKNEKEAETGLLQHYLGRTYTKEILKYLYLHPSARHKELADELSVSASHLSEILTELIQADIVRKKRQSKYSFYSLSHPAYEYTKSKLIKGVVVEKSSYMSNPFSLPTNVDSWHRKVSDNFGTNKIRFFVEYNATKEEGESA